MIVLVVSAFIMQGFQCASREMTTAKVAYQNKDYNKAIDFVKQELQKNPNNLEAEILLTESYLLVNDVENAHKSYLKIAEKDTAKIVKERKQGLRNQLWVKAYNEGFINYQNYNKTKDEKYLEKSLALVQIGSFHMPRIVDFFVLEASIYEAKKDEAKAKDAYVKFVDNLKNELDFAKNNNVYVNMPAEVLTTKFGKASKSVPSMRSNGDSVRTDIYSIKGSQSYFFLERIEGKNWQVIGWRINPPRDWADGEKQQSFALNTLPFGALATHFYHKEKDKESALKYIKLLCMLEPTNSDANTSMVNLYIELDKKDEAIKEIEALTKKEPDNKVYFEQFGSLYMSFNDYDKAIEQYETSLKIDPTYDFALRNIGSAYKNKAYKLQIAEQDKFDKDPKYKINTDSYFPFLTKSAEYFERSLNTEKFRDDMDVLSEIANIYLVTNDQAKLQATIKKLENIELTLDKDQKLSYYLKMMKIYGDMKNNEKLAEIEKKYKEITK